MIVSLLSVAFSYSFSATALRDSDVSVCFLFHCQVGLVYLEHSVLHLVMVTGPRSIWSTCGLLFLDSGFWAVILSLEGPSLGLMLLFLFCWSDSGGGGCVFFPWHVISTIIIIMNVSLIPQCSLIIVGHQDSQVSLIRMWMNSFICVVVILLSVVYWWCLHDLCRWFHNVLGWMLHSSIDMAP